MLIEFLIYAVSGGGGVVLALVRSSRARNPQEVKGPGP